MEREREQEPDSEKPKELSHDITVNGTPYKTSMPEGASLLDTLKKFCEGKNLELSKFSVMFNGREINFKDGKLVENPVLVNASVVSLLEKFSGGNPSI